MTKGKRGAPMGNRNAAGKRVFAANVGGFATGALQPVKFAKTSRSRYEKLGAGMTGHKVGVGARRLATFDFKSYK